MSDLISRQALREAMYHEIFETDRTDSDMVAWESGCWIRYKMFENAIKSAPTIDPVKHGEWIDNKVAFHWVCSECGCTVRMDKGQVFDRLEDEYNYCPNCGAKMDGEEE